MLGSENQNAKAISCKVNVAKSGALYRTQAFFSPSTVQSFSLAYHFLFPYSFFLTDAALNNNSATAAAIVCKTKGSYNFFGRETKQQKTITKKKKEELNEDLLCNSRRVWIVRCLRL